MTDQMIPADQVRRARQWARDILDDVENGANVGAYARDAARTLMAMMPLPTLADMTVKERAACQWMQADVDGEIPAGIIAKINPTDAHVIASDGETWFLDHDTVTPRPDLPRMEWPSDKKADDVPPVKVGDVIESADDPRIANLPLGTTLLDRDGEAVAKHSRAWAGIGYIPIPSEGDEFSPWTVARLPKKPAPAPTLPEGWRLADHKDHGRVIVTNPTPKRDGRVYCVLPSATPLGYDWLFCDPAELTYIDTDQEADTADTVPESTLAVGSVWADADALTRACEESGRDQIAVLEHDGRVYVWDATDECWEGFTSPSTAPYTVIHTGKKANQ